MRLSHSAKDLYLQCPLKYKLHYIDRKRSIRTSSALVFGTALDEALNELLLTRSFAGADLVFTEQWNTHKDSMLIDYFKSDADAGLLTLAQAELIDAETDEAVKWQKLCWYSLYQKGRAMLEAYERDILPRIRKVIAVQERIELRGQDESGQESEDSITGIIDVIAEVETDDGEIVTAILDNKTSSAPYPKNSIDTKEQTALYCTAKPEYEHAGFAVLLKKKVGATQLLIGKPPEELKQKTLDKFVEVLDNINAGNFPQNRKSCFSFGQSCIYMSYCNGRGFDANIVTKEAEDR